ncbi:MAG: type III pantothenate kinase [Bacilli bacterium]
MILVMDCGNSAIKIGVYENDKIVSHYVMNTFRNRSIDEYAAHLKNVLKDINIEGAIISCVVPLLTRVLCLAIKKAFNIVSLVVGKELKTKLPIKIDNPGELGSDLLCGAVGAISKYKYPLLVADLGTATKLYVIDKNGNYIGGVITLGMEGSLHALVENTSMLLEVPIVAPKHIISRNTKEAIQSGIVYGQAYMISEFARRMEKELGYELNRIVTGGYAPFIEDQIVCFHYEEYLVLDGLYKIYLLNK